MAGRSCQNICAPALRPALALTALLLAGCASITPKPSEAVPPVAGAYQFGAERAAPAVPTRWAREFGSAELTRLAAVAQDQNLDIAAAYARIVQAEAQAASSAARLYPQLGGNLGASASQNPSTTGRADPPFPVSKGQQYSLGLSASYMLDLWGANRATLDAARLNAEGSVYDREVIKIATEAAVVTSYVNLVSAQERMKIAGANTALANRVLGAMKARLAAGTGTALDVAQQDSVVAQQLASRPVFEQNAQQAQVALAVLLGQTPEAFRVKGGSVMALKVPSVRAGLPAQLLLRRPDIAAAEARLRSAGASVDAARAAFFPEITLTAQGGLESMLLRNLLRPEALALSIAASAAQKIFTGFQLEAQLELSKGRHGELMIGYRKSILQAFADVENALIAVRQSAAQEAAQVRVLQAARRANAITEQRLREGTIDIVTLLNVQLTLFNAEDALVQARARRLLAAASLYQALGGGFVLPQVSVAP